MGYAYKVGILAIVAMAIALKRDHGSIEIEIPRDRNASFDPQIVSKGQTRIKEMDNKVSTLYTKSMSTRVSMSIQEMDDADS